jgi:hypothetical protein
MSSRTRRCKGGMPRGRDLGRAEPRQPRVCVSGLPGANDRLFTVRQNAGSISACLSYPPAFTYTRRRAPSPERGGIRGDLSSSLCHPFPRFAPFSRVDNTCVGAHRTFAGVCSWRAIAGLLVLWSVV